MKNCVTFELRGAVQTGGVRPFFWKIVSEAGLTGWTANSDKGIFLRLEGTDEQISSFIRSLPATAPGAFRLNSVCVIKRETNVPDDKCQPFFRLLDEVKEIPEIRADRVPCPDCVREALDSSSRRYCYPFFSCAECGPQYSYALRSPFIRRNTSLTAFPMCADCKAEKENTDDLHHCHSETLACPHCGPQFFLLDMYGDLVSDANPLCLAREALKNGEIVAVQALYGGFQLFADAFNQDTILRLRRKRKLPDRPLCLMARDLETIRKYCECSEKEAELLTSPAAPVLILRKKKNPEAVPPLAEAISPDTDTLAVGLPPSLPEKLIFEHRTEISVPPFDMLVTCGDNRPGKAECLDIDEIFNRLMAFTDKFLCHDLKTSHPCPPSICQVYKGKTIFLRRARGDVPQGIATEKPFPKIVGAFGCDSQAAVAIGMTGQIIPSQAVGTLDGDAETGILREMFERFTYLFDCVPDVMACDMNRDSFSARACADFADLHGLPLVTIQTHHAHALACMAEHRLKRALALVLNNGSPGPDGTEWGSECLDARLDGFSRIAAFQPGSAENRRPARLFIEQLIARSIEPSPELLARLGVDYNEYELWKKQYVQPAELTHSALRLINTICAGIGIAPDFCTYPDRCLLLLRKYAQRFEPGSAIPEQISSRFQFRSSDENGFRLIDWSETFCRLAELKYVSEKDKVLYAEAFYRALADSLLDMAEFARENTGLREIVLSGSLFQDPVLLAETEQKLAAGGFQVFTHELLPSDESCVPIGQTYAAGFSAGE